MKLHAEQLSNLAAAPRSPRASARCRPIISNMPTRPASQAMAKAGTVAVLLPGAFYFLRETQKPPVELLRKHGVPIAIATDCNPGTSPLTSLLLTMNMAATLFRLTVDECLAGVTREAARALGRLDEVGTLEAGKSLRSRDLGHRAPGRAGLPHGLQPAPCARLEGPMTSSSLTPGDVALADWRAIYRGAVVDARSGLRAGDRARAPRRSQRSSPRASRSTASTPASASWPACASTPADLATLQRNIVLSHAAGVGEPMPVADRAADDGAEARQPRAGRLGRAARDRAPARGDAGASGLTPVVPCQGSVGASGDLAPLAHMAAAMIGVGEMLRRRRPHAGRRGAGASRAAAARRSAPKEGLALLNGTQFSTAYALAGAVRGRDAVPARRWSPARCRPTRRAAPTRRSIRASMRCAAIAARSRRRDALRALMAGSADPRLASGRRRARAGPLLPALPAAGDGRRARPAAPGGGDAGDRGQRRLRQSADLRRRPARRCRAAISTPSRSPSPPT